MEGMVGYINETLARGLARQTLRTAREEVNGRIKAVLSTLSHGPQRAGPKYRRVITAMKRELGDAILAQVRGGTAYGRGQRSMAFAFLAVPAPEDGFDNVGCLVLTVPEKRPDELDIGELPIVIYQHALERLHLRLQADSMVAYHPELSGALAPLVSHYLVQNQWPELVASDGQYLIPSPSGLFYGRIEGKVLRVVTFIDQDKLGDTQAFEKEAVHHQLMNICRAAGLEYVE
jgi:hypothetical protein